MPIKVAARQTPAHRVQQRGFSYLLLLLSLTVLGLAAALTVRLGASMHRRASEQALLETGAAFGWALRNYARVTPAGQPDAPRRLQDLLRDPRFPGTVRHLRRIPADPLTGQADWGLVLDEQDKTILGVFSKAPGQPIKVAGFDGRFADFERKLSYQAWVFTAPPELVGRNGLRRGLIQPGEMVGRDSPVTEPTGDSAADRLPQLVTPPGR